MSYSDIYSYCQKLDVPISRNKARARVMEILGLPKIPTVKVRLDTTICRGFYLSARNASHKIVQQHGSHVIVLPREEAPNWSGLNYCWERFVFTKELMHIFDDPEEATDSGEAFDKVLEELMMPTSPQWSPQMISELDCFWMALGVLCPEKTRAELAKERAASQLDDYSIALRLRIPEQYIPNLFSARFEQFKEDVQKGNI